MKALVVLIVLGVGVLSGCEGSTVAPCPCAEEPPCQKIVCEKDDLGRMRCHYERCDEEDHGINCDRH